MSDDEWEYPLKNRVGCDMQKTIMYTEKDVFPIVETVFNRDLHDMDVSIHHCIWMDEGKEKICNLCCPDGGIKSQVINRNAGFINNENKG